MCKVVTVSSNTRKTISIPDLNPKFSFSIFDSKKRRKKWGVQLSSSNESHHLGRVNAAVVWPFHYQRSNVTLNCCSEKWTVPPLVFSMSHTSHGFFLSITGKSLPRHPPTFPRDLGQYATDKIQITTVDPPTHKHSIFPNRRWTKCKSSHTQFFSDSSFPVLFPVLTQAAAILKHVPNSCSF